MRPLSIALTLVPLLVPIGAAAAQCRSASADEAGCRQPTDLHVSSAVLGTPPLVWSPVEGNLVPPPAGTAGWGMGRTIPLDRIIGRKIASVGAPVQAVSYNTPTSDPGAIDPGTVLMPLLPPKRSARFRGVYH